MLLTVHGPQAAEDGAGAESIGRPTIDLIVNADDFGRSPAINRAVLRAHHSGILTSASLMVAGDAFDEAVEIARRTPTLAVGLHLVVIDGRPMLPPEKIPHILDQQGRFRRGAFGAGMCYYFRPAARRELAAEMRAQFERFAATGLPLSHVDGHCHMHMHPVVFDLLIPLAREFGAKRLRIPRDDLALALRHDPSRAMLKLGWTLIFGMLAARARRHLSCGEFDMPQRTYGFMQTGHMSEAYLLALAPRIDASPAEVYFHPTDGPRIDPLGPNPGDLAALLSPRVRRAFADSEVRLTTDFLLRPVAEGQ